MMYVFISLYLPVSVRPGAPGATNRERRSSSGSEAGRYTKWIRLEKAAGRDL